MKTITISLEEPLTQTYMVHAALLAVKLLALSPLAALTWVNKGIFLNADIVRRAYLTELKNLAPFWTVGALYLTTSPPLNLGVSLFRIYTISRTVVIFGYATKPIPAAISDFALVTSYLITFYMAVCVIYYYRKAI
ncbi:microsomal glutathione S-transferase 1-like [Melitaea cinxia]|uniref:microsomal glutathione S-transferase 1-like n=1 Tax=Melitaea cinxia TaxID=113334 RepID=UPI001E27022B|nr:microsomal glutathione S-transferase 1-like [Melitaea cinxia]